MAQHHPYCEAYLKDGRPCPYTVKWAHVPSGSLYCGYHKPDPRRPVTPDGYPA